MISNGYKYAAFISYRHTSRDTEVAKLVQYAIETYVLPKGLKLADEAAAGWGNGSGVDCGSEGSGEGSDSSEACSVGAGSGSGEACSVGAGSGSGKGGGSNTDDGGGGASSNEASPRTSAAFEGGKPLGKCFRDEDELAAAHSLPERISEALQSSSAMVVVCSPEACESAWVQREIEAFIEAHGRERVFCVLAAGDSHTSIPEILRYKTVRDVDGVERRIPAEPLAADFRTSATAKLADEKLRLIAAIAGCGFDDLRQRARSRKHRRIGAGVAAALALFAIVGGFAINAHNSQQSALAEESRTLAARSQQLYAQGDRYGAIEAALAALPTSAADTSRPLVPEAQTALQTALQTSYTEDIWLPYYSLEQDNSFMIAANSQDNYIGIMDESTIIYPYQLSTGAPLPKDEFPAGGTFEYFRGKSVTVLLDAFDESHAAYPVINDLYVVEETLFVISSDSPENEYWVSPYSWKLQAFGAGYQVIYEYDGVTQAALDLGYMTNDSLAYSGAPDIIGYAPEQDALAIAYGTHILVLSATSGEEIYSTTCPAPIVGAKWYPDSYSNQTELLIACADGSIWEKEPFGVRYATEGYKTRTILPYYLKQAIFVPYGNELYLVVLEAFDYWYEYDRRVAEGEFPYEDTTQNPQAFLEGLDAIQHTDKVLVYIFNRFQNYKGENTYSLDELIALAHETLFAAGR